jgi:hypothetical protein
MAKKRQKAYTESFFLPFWRRRESTFFPVFELMRLRKPCLRARFFFFGW